jgi:hypothetical protein
VSSPAIVSYFSCVSCNLCLVSRVLTLVSFVLLLVYCGPSLSWGLCRATCHFNYQPHALPHTSDLKLFFFIAESGTNMTRPA